MVHCAIGTGCVAEKYKLYLTFYPTTNIKAWAAGRDILYIDLCADVVMLDG